MGYIVGAKMLFSNCLTEIFELQNRNFASFFFFSALYNITEVKILNKDDNFLFSFQRHGLHCGSNWKIWIAKPTFCLFFFFLQHCIMLKVKITNLRQRFSSLFQRHGLHCGREDGWAVRILAVGPARHPRDGDCGGGAHPTPATGSVGKKPMFFLKTSPVGFFVFLVLFFVFLVFFSKICPEERVFRVFSVSRILFGASRLKMIITLTNWPLSPIIGMHQLLIECRFYFFL